MYLILFHFSLTTKIFVFCQFGLDTRADGSCHKIISSLPGLKPKNFMESNLRSLYGSKTKSFPVLIYNSNSRVRDEQTMHPSLIDACIPAAIAKRRTGGYVDSSASILNPRGRELK